MPKSDRAAIDVEFFGVSVEFSLPSHRHRGEGFVDLIKIDVEGYEMEVLKGAVNTLDSVRYLMIELNNNTKKYGSSNIEIETHIKTLGYKVLMDHWPDKVFYRP